MVYPLPEGQGDHLVARRRDVQRRLDELDVRLGEVNRRMEAMDHGLEEGKRLSAERNRLIGEFAGLIAELDELEEPEGDYDDGDDDMGESARYDEP